MDFRIISGACLSAHKKATAEENRSGACERFARVVCPEIVYQIDARELEWQCLKPGATTKYFEPPLFFSTFIRILTQGFFFILSPFL